MVSLQRCHGGDSRRSQVSMPLPLVTGLLPLRFTWARGCPAMCVNMSQSPLRPDVCDYIWVNDREVGLICIMSLRTMLHALVSVFLPDSWAGG